MAARDFSQPAAVWHWLLTRRQHAHQRKLAKPSCLENAHLTPCQYCGEEGPDCILKAAVVCSNPFNLEVSSKILQNSFFSREVYLRVMGSTWQFCCPSDAPELILLKLQ